jgi:hypothetical protein
MKKLFLLLAFASLACMSIVPIPGKPAATPLVVIIENETLPVATMTVEPRLAVITQEKMLDAETFQLILLTRVAAGDSLGVAEMVKYPITVSLNGATALATSQEFEENYQKIFTDRIIEVVSDTSDGNLTLLPDGIRLGQGEIWFNLYCANLSCSETEFFITQINN